MSYEYIAIWVLSGLAALLLAVIYGGIAGFLHHLGGNRLPAVLMKAGTAFGTCVTLNVPAGGLAARAI
ncbi:hypothetical protein [Streptomyces sp. S1]|uniref:hypothetical protein n=1 Tax=Streptomyces sp. S1 TaxID=718288 RepID=UPI003D709CBE